MKPIRWPRTMDANGAPQARVLHGGPSAARRMRRTRQLMKAGAKIRWDIHY
jgi:hypothetical protein